MSTKRNRPKSEERPSTKRVRRLTDTQAKAWSEATSASGRKTLGGYTKGVVCGIKKLASSTQYSITASQTLQLQFELTKKEQEQLKFDEETKNMDLTIYAKGREPLTIQQGEDFDISVFQGVDTDITLACLVEVTNLRYGVEYTKTGQPYVVIKGKVSLLEKFSLPKVLEMLHECPPISMASLEAYIMNKDSGMEVETMNPMIAATSSKANSTKLATRVLYDKGYRKHHTWFVMDNTILYDTSAYSEKMDFAGSKLPVFFAETPSNPDEDSSGMALSHWLRVDPATKDTTPVSICCIRETNNRLTAISQNTDYSITANVPCYFASEIFNVYDTERWPSIGPQLFQHLRALVCTSLNVNETLALYKTSVERSIVDATKEHAGAFTGFLHVFPDLLHTLQWAGLEQTCEFAFEWVKRYWPIQENHKGWLVDKDVITALNPLSKTINKMENLDNIPVVHLPDVDCILEKKFKADKWRFFIVPPKVQASSGTAELSLHDRNVAGDLMANKAHAEQYWAGVGQKTGVFAIPIATVSLLSN